MFLAQTYLVALLLMLLSMLCWGSWANTLKLCPGFRFQLFYWDYAIGLALGAIFWGATAGSHGQAGTPFLTDAAETPIACVIFAVVGGVIFNIANLLIVAAIDVAGLAVAWRLLLARFQATWSAPPAIPCCSLAESRWFP